MTGVDRKPVVVALVCVAVAVLLFATGTAGTVLRGTGGSGIWQERLGDLRIGEPVTTGDLLAIGANCTIGPAEIRWSGSCLVRIEEFGGRFSLRTTKNFRAEVVAGPVDARLEVRGTPVEDTVPTGESIEFTVGRAGGFLGLQCGRFGPDPCAIALE
ncbi:hypothetical protein [Kocuria rhizosphaericola]|uniref:hypothetical protein n=1 Tax=Kocuria rhizosphaericola TaxID=3376284 RepID=UPI0037B951FB